MSRAVAAAVGALFCAGCTIQPLEQPDAGQGTVHPDAGGGVGTGGGGTGGGGSGGLDAGGGGGGPNLDGGLGWGGDGGTSATVPGSGKNGDQGTGMLVLVRVDRGTANITAQLATLVQQWVDGLNGAGFTVSSVGVADLYTGSMIWATRIDQHPTASLSDSLRSASSQAAGAPQACTTDALASQGASLGSLQAAGVTPFNPAPGAFTTVMIETGPRPQPLSSCPGASFFAGDPAGWANFGGYQLSRAATRFAFLATSETESLDQMRARCLSLQGFPSTATDSLAPSAVGFLGPLSDQMDAVQPGLASPVDLCTALGASGLGASKDFAKQWYDYLASRR